MPFLIFTMGLVNVLTSLVSIKRLSRFLGLSEVRPVVRKSVPTTALVPALTISNGDAANKDTYTTSTTLTTTSTADGTATDSTPASTDIAVSCSIATNFYWDLKLRPTLKNIELQVYYPSNSARSK
jgi:hypothetical protein